MHEIPLSVFMRGNKIPCFTFKGYKCRVSFSNAQKLNNGANSASMPGTASWIVNSILTNSIKFQVLLVYHRNPQCICHFELKTSHANNPRIEYQEFWETYPNLFIIFFNSIIHNLLEKKDWIRWVSEGIWPNANRCSGLPFIWTLQFTQQMDNVQPRQEASGWLQPIKEGFWFGVHIHRVKKLSWNRHRKWP